MTQISVCTEVHSNYPPRPLRPLLPREAKDRPRARPALGGACEFQTALQFISVCNQPSDPSSEPKAARAIHQRKRSSGVTPESQREE